MNATAPGCAWLDCNYATLVNRLPRDERQAQDITFVAAGDVIVGEVAWATLASLEPAVGTLTFATAPDGVLWTHDVDISRASRRRRSSIHSRANGTRRQRPVLQRTQPRLQQLAGQPFDTDHSDRLMMCYAHRRLGPHRALASPQELEVIHRHCLERARPTGLIEPAAPRVSGEPRTAGLMSEPPAD